MRKAPTLTTIFAVAMGLGAALVRADDDDDGEEHHERRARQKIVAAPESLTYRAECASCHMLYPPGLLPARSWTKLMGGLKDHFGENATMDDATAVAIGKFLTDNAADRSAARGSQKIAGSIAANDAPLKFSETRYFRREHHEIGAKVWERQAIGTRGNCVACHGRAEAGTFSEDEVKIPR